MNKKIGMLYVCVFYIFSWTYYGLSIYLLLVFGNSKLCVFLSNFCVNGVRSFIQINKMLMLMHIGYKRADLGAVTGMPC